MRLKIGTYFDTPLYLHISLLPFLGILCYFYDFETIAIVIVAFLFVIFHEYGHSFTAKSLGFNVENIVIYPFGGRVYMTIPPDNPRDELKIAIAGPLVNLFFFGIFVFIASYGLVSGNPALCYIGSTGASINAMLSIFNMLPIFPVDGGYILRSCLTLITGDYIKATIYAVRVSQGLCVIFCVLAMIYLNYLIGIILFAMILLSQSELEYVFRSQIINNIKSKIAVVLNNPRIMHMNYAEIVQVLKSVTDPVNQKLLKTTDLIVFFDGMANLEKGQNV